MARELMHVFHYGVMYNNKNLRKVKWTSLDQIFPQKCHHSVNLRSSTGHLTFQNINHLEVEAQPRFSQVQALECSNILYGL